MRLEGTLDAFSLPDIFQLLSFTKKTGTLHLRRAGETGTHGVVHLRDGAVTGARSDEGRQALGRRLVGTGLVDDDALEEAASVVAEQPTTGLARALHDLGGLDPEMLRELAVEQATDAVFDLLRWPDGEFAFVVDEPDPDDLGAVLPVDEVVAEGRRRLEHWQSLADAVAPDAVVTVAAAPEQDPVLSREEWAMLSVVDGRRTVSDIVVLSGRGEYAVVTALAGLAARGLLLAQSEVHDDPVGRRQQLLAQLEGIEPELSPAPSAEPAAAAPAPASRPPVRPAVPRAAVIPERPEPFTAPRRPDHAEQAPSYAQAVSSPQGLPRAGGSGGGVHGSAAMQLSTEPATTPSAYIERDPSVNKSLLLRLIAGVRGL